MIKTTFRATISNADLDWIQDYPGFKIEVQH